MDSGKRSDRDILIGLETDVKWLVKGFANHLSHHRLYTIAFIGVIGAAILTFLFK